MIISATMEFHSAVGIKVLMLEVYGKGGRWDPTHVTEDWEH